MNWKQAKHIDDNKYDLPGDWLQIEYFEALNMLFRIENSLRVFVYIILKNEFQDKWKTLSLTSDDAEDSSIGAMAKKRLSQDKNYAYLGYVISSPLLHLTSGELIRIITSDSYWKLFKSYFPGSKEIMRNKLDEIGNVRNSLAHFRPIKKGDIDLVKQNSIHTLSVIEKTIEDFITCRHIVPTNTGEQWYTELGSIGTEHCTLSFNQSENEDWIKIVLWFNPPILSSYSNYRTGQSFTTLNLNANNLLLLNSNLTKYIICATESLPSKYTTDINRIEARKNLMFTLSRQSVAKHYAEIKTEFEKIILDISKEIALIKEDNLAKGKLVQVIEGEFFKPKDNGFYLYDGESFQTEIDENSPVEFWGTLKYSSKNFITDSDTYPWMPTNISEDKGLPF